MAKCFANASIRNARFLFLARTKHTPDSSLITVNELRIFLVKSCNFHNDEPLRATLEFIYSMFGGNVNCMKSNYIKIGGDDRDARERKSVNSITGPECTVSPPVIWMKRRIVTVEAVITRTKIESVTKMRRVEILNTSVGAEMCRLRIGWIYKWRDILQKRFKIRFLAIKIDLS